MSTQDDTSLIEVFNSLFEENSSGLSVYAYKTQSLIVHWLNQSFNEVLEVSSTLDECEVGHIVNDLTILGNITNNLNLKAEFSQLSGFVLTDVSRVFMTIFHLN